MSKFKVGDKVRVLRNVTPVKAKDAFVGEIHEIKDVLGYSAVRGSKYDTGRIFVVWDAEIELADTQRKIVITTDGKTTLARLYDGKRVVRSAEARCAPSDTFDFELGAGLAFDRLMGRQGEFTEPEQEPVKLYCVKEHAPGSWLTKGKVYDVSDGRITYDDGWSTRFVGNSNRLEDASGRSAYPVLGHYCLPLVKRPAKVGEWVLPAAGSFSFLDGTTPFQVKTLYSSPGVVGIYVPWRIDLGDGYWALNLSQYLVLDGYQPESEYYSGKVVCTNDCTGFTAGKVYVFNDGRTVDDDGCVQPSEDSCPIADLQQGWVRARNLIEFKGEVSE